MRRAPTRPGRRGGFTLVELLVVITIIAILFALTSAAVVKALGKSDEVRTRNDISQLQSAIQAFKTDFQAGYIPDKLILPPGYDPTGASQRYISTLWPRIYAPPLPDVGTLTASTNQFTKNGQPFLLNGVQHTPFTYWRVPGSQPIVLQGYQTIVFFLGGSWDPTLVTPATPIVDRIGFSTNAVDPMLWTGPTGAGTRKGPYFDFPTNRLAILPSDALNNSQYPGFPGFIDVFGTMPYVYFSSAKAGNDYTNYSAVSPPNGPGPQKGTTTSGATFALIPFQISSNRYANPNGFQIISAGKDTQFGDGGVNWAGGGGAVSMVGYDDIANFHPTQLGIAAP